ncbi:hypothetical protein CKO51_27180 [Rhodopirellula sp. SM50]|nr:GTPase domain-containing protein [Rhodopirellula sp. SM50]PAY16339.1 hypothetical protein CKO51_27180 [Rhodopirellula sp. SM50]
MKREDFEKLHDDPIHFCIIGHTNHGKTTTIRTLASDESIGVVANKANVTPGVSPYRISKNGKTQYWVYDTAGFSAFGRRMLQCEEDLEHRPNIHEFVDFLDRVTDPQAAEMAGSLRKVIDCHLAVVVVDTRKSSSTADYLDEIDFLRTCGTPIVVSLNFLHSKKSKPETWRSQLIKLGVTNIVEFDAHVRTRKDEKNLFRSLEALSQSQLHKDFIEYWIESRDRAAGEKDLRAIVSIKRGVFALSALSVQKTKLNRGNAKVAQKQAIEEFQDMLADCLWKSLVDVLACYDVQEKYIELKTDGRRIRATNERRGYPWRPNWFKAGTTGGAAATVAAIEVATGGITLGIPTAITFLATYGGMQMAEVKMNPDGTAFTVAISHDQLIQLAGCMMEQAQRARILGRGAFPSPNDPNQTVPFQVYPKSNVFANDQVREAVLDFARTRPKRSESFDAKLMEILTQ